MTRHEPERRQAPVLRAPEPSSNFLRASFFSCELENGVRSGLITRSLPPPSSTFNRQRLGRIAFTGSRGRPVTLRASAGLASGLQVHGLWTLAALIGFRV